MHSYGLSLHCALHDVDEYADELTGIEIRGTGSSVREMRREGWSMAEALPKQDVPWFCLVVLGISWQTRQVSLGEDVEVTIGIHSAC